MKESQEIKIRYEAGKMIFQVGTQEFYLTEETAGSIFGRSVGIEFERVHSRDQDFGGLRSLSNYVLIQRLLRKGLNLPQVSQVLGHPEEQVRQFYSRERARPQVESFNVNSLEIERRKQAEEEVDFVKEIHRDRALNEAEAPEPGARFIDLQQVRTLQKQGMRSGKIAEFLGVEAGEFDKFMEKNQRYLDLLP